MQEYRKLKCISVKQASEEIGISRQHIYDIEKGKAFPSRKLSLKICKWSNGLVTRLELLYTDLTTSAKDNLIKLENWEEKGGRNKKRKFHDIQSMKNEDYMDIQYGDKR